MTAQTILAARDRLARNGWVPGARFGKALKDSAVPALSKGFKAAAERGEWPRPALLLAGPPPRGGLVSLPQSRVAFVVRGHIRLERALLRGPGVVDLQKDTDELEAIAVGTRQASCSP